MSDERAIHIGTKTVYFASINQVDTVHYDILIQDRHGKIAWLMDGHWFLAEGRTAKEAGEAAGKYYENLINAEVNKP